MDTVYISVMHRMITVVSFCYISPLPPLPKTLCPHQVPADLTPEERSELEEIRRRKGALLLEIQRLREELREAIIEVEGLESSTEGRSGLHI